jgi:TonB family protein
MRLGTLAAIPVLACVCACAGSDADRDTTACLARCKDSCSNWVIVEFDVSEDGHVQDPRVVEECPDSSFNSTALRAVRTWRYGPEGYGKHDVKVKLQR